MQLKLEESEKSALIHISGKLSFKDHPEFNIFIDGLEIQGKTVTFDVQGLEQIDSAGIGMLFLADKVITEASGSMVIKNPTGQVKRIFDITSIGAQIKVVED